MTFYPFQWDLNFTNPIVFNEMMHNILFLTNLGVDFLLFNGSPSLWKKARTSCKMLKKSNVLNFLIFSIMKIVCPGVIAWIDVIQHKDKKEDSDSNLQLDETKKKLKIQDFTHITMKVIARMRMISSSLIRV